MDQQGLNGISVDGKVVRADGTGVRGVVVSIREEIGTKAVSSESGIIIGVQWDNGTLSFFTPDALRALN